MDALRSALETIRYGRLECLGICGVVGQIQPLEPQVGVGSIAEGAAGNSEDFLPGFAMSSQTPEHRDECGAEAKALGILSAQALKCLPVSLGMVNEPFRCGSPPMEARGPWGPLV